MRPAATSAMSCAFSALVSVTIESSYWTVTPPSSGNDTPKPRAHHSRECEIVARDAVSAFSCLRMLRMSALLSEDTSVAVFTVFKDLHTVNYVSSQIMHGEKAFLQFAEPLSIPALT